MNLAGSRNVINYASEGTEEKALKSSSSSRIRNIATATTRALNPIMGTDKRAQEELLGLRKDLLKVMLEAQNTEKLLLKNMQELKRAASAGDESASAIIKYLEDTERSDISQKMRSGQELSTSESAHLVQSLETFASAMSNIDLDMKVAIPDLLKDYTEQLEKVEDPVYKKKLLSSLIKFLEESGIQSTALQDLIKINNEGIELEGKHLTKVSGLLNHLADDVIGREVITPVKNMAKSLDTSVLDQKELQDTFDKESKVFGKSLKDILLNSPGMLSKGKGLLEGGMHTLFSSMGLDVLNMMGAPELLAGGGLFKGAKDAFKGAKQTAGDVLERGRGIRDKLSPEAAEERREAKRKKQEERRDRKERKEERKETKKERQRTRRESRRTKRTGARSLAGGARTGGRLLAGGARTAMAGASALASLAGPALGVAAAGAIGYGIGTLLNKGIDKLFGEKGGLGKKLSDVIHGSEKEAFDKQSKNMKTAAQFKAEGLMVTRYAKSTPTPTPTPTPKIESEPAAVTEPAKAKKSVPGWSSPKAKEQRKRARMTPERRKEYDAEVLEWRKKQTYRGEGAEGTIDFDDDSVPTSKPATKPTSKPAAKPIVKPIVKLTPKERSEAKMAQREQSASFSDENKEQKGSYSGKSIGAEDSDSTKYREGPVLSVSEQRKLITPEQRAESKRISKLNKSMRERSDKRKALKQKMYREKAEAEDARKRGLVSTGLSSVPGAGFLAGLLGKKSKKPQPKKDEIVWSGSGAEGDIDFEAAPVEKAAPIEKIALGEEDIGLPITQQKVLKTRPPVKQVAVRKEKQRSIQPIAPPPPQIIQIPVPMQQEQSNATSRKMVIDDYGIALANSLLFE